MPTCAYCVKVLGTADTINQSGVYAGCDHEQCATCIKYINANICASCKTILKQATNSFSMCDTLLTYAIKSKKASISHISTITTTENVNTPDKAGNTPLSLSLTNNKSMLEIILNSGADTSTVFPILCTAITKSAPIDCVQLLIDKSLTIHDKNANGANALMCAIIASKSSNCRVPGTLTIITELIKSGINVNDTDNDGYTALMHAVHEDIGYDRPTDDVKIVDLLLNSGADINHVAKDGSTALMLATCDVTKANATKNIVPNKDNTSLLVLIRSLISYNFEYGSYSYLDSILGRIKLLIRLGTNLEITEETGYTALFVAISITGSVMLRRDIMKTLIKSGANVNHATIHGLTPLMVASNNSNKVNCDDIVQLLVDSGADVNRVTICKNSSALLYAVLSSNTTSTITTVQILLTAGANPNYVYADTRTALICAVSNSNTTSNVGTVQLLIQFGANVNYVHSSGNTAFMYAAAYLNTSSNIDALKLLIMNGAKIEYSKNIAEKTTATDTTNTTNITNAYKQKNTPDNKNIKFYTDAVAALSKTPYYNDVDTVFAMDIYFGPPELQSNYIIAKKAKCVVEMYNPYIKAYTDEINSNEISKRINDIRTSYRSVHKTLWKDDLIQLCRKCIRELGEIRRTNEYYADSASAERQIRNAIGGYEDDIAYASRPAEDTSW